MATPIAVTFAAGRSGDWRIDRVTAVSGAGLPAASRLAFHEGPAPAISDSAAWTLRGITSNARYATRAELDALNAIQEGLGRLQSSRAALIPIRKTAAWWELAQDERRAILEERSHHNRIGREYLPAIARRLYHSRELCEPFDFLTWFEYAPQDAEAFEALVQRLRETEEWRYVEREIDIRLTRDGHR